MTREQHLLLARPEQLYVSFIKDGTPLTIPSLPAGLRFCWIDPRTGTVHTEGRTTAGQSFRPPDPAPWVWVAAKE